jgi:gliding motility-associated lipoprotein GldH
VYNEYQKVNSDGWDFGTPINFKTAISDTLSKHNLTLHIRNNPSYPYQNFWVFIESTSPSGTVQKDTLEYLLADNTGKWLGQGLTSTKEVAGLYLGNVVFPEQGVYSFSIYQGMRNASLKGIESVGLRIEKQK